MTVTKPLEYLYYRIYDWNRKTWGAIDGPQFNALVGVSFLLFLNLYSIVELIGVFLGIELPAVIMSSVTFSVVSFVVIAGINYFVFIYGDRYERIAQKFSGESHEKRIIRLILCFAYAIFTFVLAFAGRSVLQK